MSSSSSSGSSSGGAGVLGVLGIIFVTAKLVGYIDWSWWLVLLPIYGGFILMLVFLMIFFLIAAPASR